MIFTVSAIERADGRGVISAEPVARRSEIRANLIMIEI
jgi:hypothetical protein